MLELSLAGARDVTTAASVGDFLKLMADPTRRRIFLELMKGETCNCEMAGLLGLPQNLISHHLRQLRQAGLIRTRRDERDQRWIYYWVDRDALARAQAELTWLFDPARLGERVPDRGPFVRGCR